MAGGSTSEEMDAFDPLAEDRDDRTPPRPVSIYDLDEDLPTRAQSSDEIAEYQRRTREKRDPTHKSFRKASEPSSLVSGRPIPRESGPVRIERPAAAPTEAEIDLDEVLRDVAATIARLPPAPRVPSFEAQRGPPETIHEQEPPLPVAAPRGRLSVALAWVIAILAVMLVAMLSYALVR